MPRVRKRVNAKAIAKQILNAMKPKEKRRKPHRFGVLYIPSGYRVKTRAIIVGGGSGHSESRDVAGRVEYE